MTFANRVAPERRELVAGLRPGDKVAIGRHADQAEAAIAEGEVEAVTSVRYVKVRVGASRITFYPTGLERGASAGGVTRGLRVILRRL